MWRQDTTKAAEPRARLSRRALRWALEGLVVQHLTVARIAEVSRIVPGWMRPSVRSAPAGSITPVFPYVYLDATYLHVRTEQAMVVSKAVVVAGISLRKHPDLRGAVDRADEGTSPFYCRADGTSGAARLSVG